MDTGAPTFVSGAEFEEGRGAWVAADWAYTKLEDPMIAASRIVAGCTYFSDLLIFPPQKELRRQTNIIVLRN